MVFFAASYSEQPELEAIEEAPEAVMQDIPDYLVGFPTDGLYGRDSEGKIIRAPEYDTAVAREYPLSWPGGFAFSSRPKDGQI